MVKRPDTSCITAGQSHGGCDPFSDLFGRGLADRNPRPVSVITLPLSFHRVITSPLLSQYVD